MRIHSAYFGDLGDFRSALFGARRSRRTWALGQGSLGGKGEGAACLDFMRSRINGYGVPVSVATRESYFGLRERKFGDFSPLAAKDLPQDQIANLIVLLKHLGWKRVAIRSSAYRPEVEHYYRALGYTAVPPLPILLQDPVGRVLNGKCFAPLLSGIINTAGSKIRVATVPGMGISAVSDALGILTRFPFDEKAIANLPMEEQKVYLGDTFALFADDQIKRAGFALNMALPASNPLYKDIANQVLLRELGRLGLAFGTVLPPAVDMEWASADSNSISIVQIRPLAKRPVLEKPECTLQQIVVSTKEAVGLGSNQFKHLIFIKTDQSWLPPNIVQSLSDKYPDAAVCINFPLDRISRNSIERGVMPFTRGLIVFDRSYGKHTLRTNLDHLALRCVDEHKVILLCGYASITKIKSESSCVLSQTFGEEWKVEVFKLGQPLTIAGDDDGEWGLAYFQE